MITLHSNLNVASGVSAVNGGYTTVNWLFFNDAAALSLVYKYFEVVACRVRIALSTVTATTDSFYGAAVAYFPINYLNEGVISAVPTQRNQVQDLPGSIFVQQGVNNTGKWFDPLIKQQFSCSDAFSSTLNRAAGSLVWYFDDAGVSEVLGDVDIEVTLKFYGREYASNPSFNHLFDLVGKQRSIVGVSVPKNVEPDPKSSFDIIKVSE